ncbi:uncharacterized protein RSE6_14455 [Rhynchosporium secalis]|uniref:Uncharacterized protein n=1 Tax=Rhynchosporium secalis TaxID=38038 RepID=A0A1E1MVB1_RHYSE|nr:uncharacterized protein RSE6_14455 [Rhynchosporium secalis]
MCGSGKTLAQYPPGAGLGQSVILPPFVTNVVSCERERSLSREDCVPSAEFDTAEFDSGCINDALRMSQGHHFRVELLSSKPYLSAFYLASCIIRPKGIIRENLPQYFSA